MFSGGRGAHPGHLVPPFCIKSPHVISVTPRVTARARLAVGPSSPPAHCSPGEGTAGAEPSVGVTNSPCLSGGAGSLTGLSLQQAWC